MAAFIHKVKSRYYILKVFSISLMCYSESKLHWHPQITDKYLFSHKNLCYAKGLIILKISLDFIFLMHDGMNRIFTLSITEDNNFF